MAENNFTPPLRINNMIWPIGAVYYTTDDQTSEGTTHNTFNGKHPIQIFGGTWNGPIEVTDSDNRSIYKFIRTA